MSKGSTPRPYDKDKFNNNFDSIFKKNKKEGQNGSSKKDNGPRKSRAHNNS
jgi:hypothetical protein